MKQRLSLPVASIAGEHATIAAMRRYEEFNIDDEDVKKMDEVADEAEDILKPSVEEGGDVEDDYEGEVAEHELTNPTNESREMSFDIPKNSRRLLFFKIFSDEVHNSGIHFDETAVDDHLKKHGGFINIKTTPFKTDRDFLNHVYFDNPVISFLIQTPVQLTGSQEVGHELEKQGLLPQGFTDRLIVSCLADLEKESTDHSGAWTDARKQLGLEAVEPISEEAVAREMRKIIRAEYQRKLGI